MAKREHKRAQNDVQPDELECVKQRCNEQAEMYKARIKEQEERIQALEDEVRTLEHKKQQVAETMLLAQGCLDGAKRQAQAIADQEAERVAGFKQRWTEYALRTMRKVDPTMMNTLDEYLAEYTEAVRHNLRVRLLLNADPMLDDLHQENARVASGCEDKPIHLDELLKRLREE